MIDGLTYLLYTQRALTNYKKHILLSVELIVGV